MVAFYNAGDQAIYNQGYSFIPQERFRLGDPNLGESTTTAPVTGGVNTLPVNMGGGSGGGGVNPYNPDMSQIRTDFRPEYDFRRYSEYGLNPSTMDRKQMDMNQEYFYDRPSAMQQKIGGLMNVIPGFGALKRGPEFVGGILNQYLPVNQRAILENQLRGQGVLTDDIGRIVAGPGGYNTPEGIMAGYNASQMTGETFDKRTGNIAETLADKYDFTPADINNLNNGIITPEMEKKAKMSSGKTSNLLSNYININLAKQNFVKTQKKADEIAAFKEAEKARKKREEAMKTQSYQNITGGDMGGDGQTPGGGGGNVTTSGGDTYGGEAYGYNEAAEKTDFYADGGRVPYMMGGLANLVDIYD